jgi:hypothetical protein
MKFLLVAAISTAAMFTTYALGAFDSKQSESPCSCCKVCVCDTCVCEASACACDTEEACSCSTACAKLCCNK